MSRFAMLVLAVVLAGACLVPDKFDPACARPNDPSCDVDSNFQGPRAGIALDQLPATLADSGLCDDASCTTLAFNVFEFQPRWELWSDGAKKRRWISLPPGAQIDNANADYWQFPVGTKLWKEFVRDGVRVETRYMVRHGSGEDDWLFVGYEWSADQSTAVAMPDGDPDVNGTGHDIPEQKQCRGCHFNVRGRVLGFSAFQLDWSAPAAALDLDDADELGWFTSLLPARSPRYPVPGTSQQRAVLGYFHANCGHCHNSRSPLINRPMFRLEVDYMKSVADTRTYRSTVNVAGTPYGGASIIAKPGDPDHSIIVTRMRASDPRKRMPALGTELLDSTGMSLVRAWITSL